MTRFDQQNQNIVGNQINIGTFIAQFFREDNLTASLATSLIIQWGIYVLGVVPYPVCFAVLISMFFPFVFGPHAVYGFIRGVQLKNSKVIVLSIATGFSSLLFYFCAITLRMWMGALDVTAQLIKSLHLIPTP